MQGFNMGRYVPPDVEGTTTGNRLHNKRPAAVPTVRFEMPFAVWCASCARPTLIGQGVRFNAEKRRVGAYHTTPVWSFRFRHAECGGAIEMQTDPRNTAYVVVRGGTKRDTGDEPPRDANAVLVTDAEREALRRNAFASLEKTIEDREQLRRAGERIADLAEASARHWEDPYAQNQRLRRAFRAGREERERAAAVADHLRDRMSLAIDLVPATDEDAKRAALVDFGAAAAADDDDDNPTGDAALSKPLFAGQRLKASGTTERARDRQKGPRPRERLKRSRTRDRVEDSRTKETLASEVMTRTRAAQDPFLQPATRDAKPPPPPRLAGVKRTRAAAGGEGPSLAARGTSVRALVQYDSD